jgi:hypothetical protein
LRLFPFSEQRQELTVQSVPQGVVPSGALEDVERHPLEQSEEPSALSRLEVPPGELLVAELAGWEPEQPLEQALEAILQGRLPISVLVAAEELKAAALELSISVEPLMERWM